MSPIEGNEKWKLDLMLPKNRRWTVSVIVLFMVEDGAGDKASGVFRDYPLEYASRGYVCASVNYRLVDGGTILDCIADCRCAVDGPCPSDNFQLMSISLVRMGIRQVHTFGDARSFIDARGTRG